MIIGNHELEYIDDSHTYLVDGIIVPSITQMIGARFKHKYDGVKTETLREAARKGTEVHEAVERYAILGEDSELPEVRGFKFLQKNYGFKVIEAEKQVILCDDIPIAAGRFDLTLELDGEIGGADIKRTSVLDREYLALQLNLYRIAYMQTYGKEWKFLRGIHLRENTRKFVEIPINEELTKQFIKEWRKTNEFTDSEWEINF